MMRGYLRSQGFIIPRHRVRSMIRSVDPIGSATRWGRTVDRRTYSVSSPNSLWHMDGHMKLIRWGFVTHGAVDGCSRLVLYLNCALSNQAKVVHREFVKAVKKYGLPSRVRSDYGGENVDVAILMNMLRGFERGSHLTGQSVHNQRIERLWRDVHKEVTSVIYKELYQLEDDTHLNIDNHHELFALHFVYLPEINKLLKEFIAGWNNHKLRTESNRTPRQVWLDGLLDNANSDSTAVKQIFEGRTLEESLDALLDRDVGDGSEGPPIIAPNAIVTSPIDLPLDREQLQQLKSTVSNAVGRVAKYTSCVATLRNILG